MRILLIGNFAPPYEEESLHNIFLLRKLKEEGHECLALNISGNSSKEEGFIDTKGFFDFVFKVIHYGWKRDVIHFFTKGYLRLGLLKLMISIFIGKLFRAKSIITIHSELFSIMGQMRSPVGGRQTLFTSFSMADKIIFNDKDTYQVASMYKRKQNFELIPLFIYLPEDLKDNESPSLRKLKDKKRIIIFSNVKYPSFLFEILNNQLSKPLDPDIGIVISVMEKPSTKLQHVLEESGKRWAENLLFIESDNAQLLLAAYKKAHIILRQLSCDGRVFFSNFTISLKKPVQMNNYLYFPTSLLFVKEGKTADLCAYIINDLLKGEDKESHPASVEDFYVLIKEIYEGKK